ncbi:MAG: hypothetical protein A3H35_18040 [Betaproteobacteria bacterium RIFCSPLOWO2_02_FULL_62_17]|nr:MAG: hypothetical protein A3H35_18040 [Betaproteobacteria bacterium RIFCSPLOWO2_02_FULL_62_17]
MSGNLIVVSARWQDLACEPDARRGSGARFLGLVYHPRPGEQDRRDYRYVDLVTFETMLDRGEFLECTEVHGNRYGTSQKRIEEIRACGKNVVLEID